MGILEKMRLDGKKAFVTGGTRGIGRSFAFALAEAGADVAIVGMHLDNAKDTAKQIAESTGRNMFAFECDIKDPTQVNVMVSAVAEYYGSLDVAVCNAGICIHKPAEKMTLAEWNFVIQTNLTGTFLTNQAAANIMLKQHSGSIINTASMSGHVVNIPQFQCAYNASKAGIIHLTKTLAVEWAQRGVRVNSISPGYIASDGLDAPELRPLVAEWLRMTPIGRIGLADELQAICVYLAGDTSKMTTGSDFVIDGAYSCI